MTPGKRWMCVARRQPGGWGVDCLAVGAPATLLDRFRDWARGGACVFGVDAPIGLPAAYAAHWPKVGGFPAFLRGLAPDDPFFSVCATLDEVGPERPFFPRGPWAGPGRADHAARLGLSDPARLLRRCDRATANRRAASCLFWTLGANQVGKAALSLWRDVLGPALRGQTDIALWPFEGRIADLVRPGRVVIAEAYPAEALRQLGLVWRGSKRRAADRASLASGLTEALHALSARPASGLAEQIAQGFGADAAGEDRFDALIGLLGLLRVLRDPERDAPPSDRETRAWEGWILGQAPGPDVAAGASVASFLDRSGA